MGLRSIFNGFFQRNADGFSLGGGIIERILTFTGGNMTFTGSGSNTMTMPSSSQTLVGRTSTDDMSGKRITLAAGGTGAGTAALKFTSGSLLTTPEVGAMGYDGAKLYMSDATGTNGRMIVHRGQTAYVTSDVSATFAEGLKSITGLALAIPASQVWAFQFHLFCNSDTGAGLKIALNWPNSPTAIKVMFMGASGTAATYRNEELTTDATINATAMSAYTGTDDFVHVSGTISNGSTAGDLQMQIQKLTSGTATARFGSYGVAWRIA